MTKYVESMLEICEILKYDEFVDRREWGRKQNMTRHIFDDP